MDAKSPQALLEADKCFQWVCDWIRIDKVPPRSVLFGSTLGNWLNNKMKIVIVGNPPNGNYEHAYFRDSSLEDTGKGGE